MMRFLMLMIPNTSEHDGQPDAPLAAMAKYNQALQRAGALLALDGLHPLSQGARVTFGAGMSRVTDAPVGAGREVIGGYWILQVRSREEAVEWARRCPAADGSVIELRQVFELSDFSAGARRAAPNG